MKIRMNCALGAVVLMPPMSFHLPAALWKNFVQTRYLVCGFSLTSVGVWLTWLMVTQFNADKYMAGLVYSPAIMVVVSFPVHRYITFGDRHIPTGRRVWRYLTVRVLGMIISKSGFFSLVAAADWNYLKVGYLIPTALAIPTYLANKYWVFAQRKTE